MTSKTALKVLFFCILAVMIFVTTLASSRQAVQQWGGLTTGPDRYWTWATLLDAYCGFLTFYVWVLFKESRWLPRLVWFVAIMLLGNMAMASYVLVQLMRLRPNQPASDILIVRHS
jgi:phosphatidylglycerophosphate synthase